MYISTNLYKCRNIEKKTSLTVVIRTDKEMRDIEGYLAKNVNGHILSIIKVDAKWDEPEFYQSAAEKIHEVVRQNAEAIDECRIYITGIDQGAIGVWMMLSKYPRLFAAAIPVNGCGDPYAIRTMKTTKVWAIGSDDSEIATDKGAIVEDVRYLAGSRYMVKSLRCYGHTDAKYTTIKNSMNISDIYTSEVLDWLEKQTRYTQLEINMIRPGLYHFEDYFRASAYLVIGTEKALLIDSGIGAADIYSQLKYLTKLPVELAITHAHGDHYGEARKFKKVYMHEADIATLPMQYARFAVRHADVDIDPRIPEDALIPVKEGDRIEIGDGIGFDVLEAPGHTVGSVAFASKELELMFTGDLMGSGEIVLLFGTADEYLDVISSYKKSMEHFLNRIKEYGDDMIYYGGHIMQDASCELVEQERITAGGVGYYNPICIDVANDMVELCDEILSGRLFPEKHDSPIPNMSAWNCKYKKAGIVYRLSK